MNQSFLALSVLGFCVPVCAQSPLHIGQGQILVYDTANGPLAVSELRIDGGGTLRVIGDFPFRLRVGGLMRVDGVVDLNGFDSPGVHTIDTTGISELGARGVAGGGDGGVGNPVTTSNSVKGGDGAGHLQGSGLGGQGGESGWSTNIVAENERRGGGGGGGALAADQPVNPNPDHASNLGLIAKKGRNGAALATGTASFTLVPDGGLAKGRAFQNSDPSDDFVGSKLLPSGQVQIGELLAPLGGRGGGAGGNACGSYVFPEFPFNPQGDEKGAGGGGGGGLGIVFARSLELGPQGKIRANGGKGGGGENTNNINRIGAGSGGGSGGYLVLQARWIDLTQAQVDCLTALGGRGGGGANDTPYGDGAGGDGGPGVIQLHVTGGLGSNVILAPGAALSALTSPDAHVLMPAPGL
ncbi:MAG TPA: hypothetical protein VK843_20150 [Planctomycetota bacterium]|nr:hypothetical protein [Planctomycetota bacterium]